ncbi:NAD(P)H-dependent oxidoreductase [Pediococcus acidilactici]
MKLVAIAGSIGEHSYNCMLVEYMRRHFQEMVEIEVLDIRGVPMFNEDQDLSTSRFYRS